MNTKYIIVKTIANSGKIIWNLEEYFGLSFFIAIMHGLIINNLHNRDYEFPIENTLGKISKDDCEITIIRKLCAVYIIQDGNKRQKRVNFLNKIATIFRINLNFYPGLKKMDVFQKQTTQKLDIISLYPSDVTIDILKVGRNYWCIDTRVQTQSTSDLDILKTLYNNLIDKINENSSTITNIKSEVSSIILEINKDRVQINFIQQLFIDLCQIIDNSLITSENTKELTSAKLIVNELQKKVDDNRQKILEMSNTLQDNSEKFNHLLKIVEKQIVLCDQFFLKSEINGLYSATAHKGSVIRNHHKPIRYIPY